MMNIYFLTLLISIFTSFLNTAQAVEKHIDVPRGLLDTQVYLSEQSSVRGTLLIRSPYLALDSYLDTVHFWTSRNFHVVLQSIAGTGHSSGEFKYLSTEEIGDAHKTLTWIDSQPFSNGKVILYGESYDGFLALAGAITKHPSVKAVVAASAPTDPKRDSFSSGGMVDYDLLKYYLDVSSSQRMSKKNFRSKIEKLFKQSIPFDQYDNFFRKEGFPDWDRFIFEASQLHFVNRGVYNRLNEIEVPVLLMAGELRDQDGSDALHAFLQRKKTFQNSKVPCATQLAIGPWLHGNQVELSQKVVDHFINAITDNSLQCQFQHQVEYIPDIEYVGSSRYIAPWLPSQIFSQFTATINRDQVEFGPFYKTTSPPPKDMISLPQICKPWELVSPGLERPFVRIPIKKSIRLAGPISAQTFATNFSKSPIEISMEIIISKSSGGWFSLNHMYNMHRTRQRVRGKENQVSHFDFQSPYLSLDLEKGDELILSFQRSHNALNECSKKDLFWMINQSHPLKVSFFFEELKD